MAEHTTKARFFGQKHHAAGADKKARNRVFPRRVRQRAEEHSAAAAGIGQYFVKDLAGRQPLTKLIEALGKAKPRSLRFPLVISRGKIVPLRRHCTCSFTTEKSARTC